MSDKKTTTRNLAELTEAQRAEAMAKYAIIAPLLEVEKATGKQWQAAAEKGGCTEKTVRRWVKRFKESGLAGLVRRERSDKGERNAVTGEMQRLVEALYLENGKRTIKNVYRLVKKYAEKTHCDGPTYATVYAICKALPASVVTMARRGETAWRDQFEAVTRFESSRPNECWQMDHCQLERVQK